MDSFNYCSMKVISALKRWWTIKYKSDVKLYLKKQKSVNETHVPIIPTHINK